MCEQKWQAYRLLDDEDINKRSIMLTYDKIPTGSIPMGQVHDGYHTFDELYYHRMILFAVLCKKFKSLAWKSKQHHPNNDPMYENYFIVGINTKEGQYTYHYHLDHYELFDVSELEHAPEWDGHLPKDITRLLSL